MVAVAEIGRHQGDIKVSVGGTVHDMSSDEIYVAHYGSVQWRPLSV